jgi:uncharacterized protein (TIGR02145 family)
MGDYGLYWSNTVNCSDNFFAWMLGLEYNKLGIDFNGLNDKHFGYSARCVKGAPLVFTTSVITTDSVRDVTDHSVSASGTVISAGSYPVYQRGICYSPASSSASIFSDPHTIDSTVGSSSFTNYITGLSPGVNYRARAYSVTCAGVSYGSSILFSTPSLPPGLSTNAVYPITTTSAVSGGVFISGGGSSISAKGVCWSTTPLPTISNSKTNDGTGLVNFTSTVTNLLPNTKYYIRAYATNAGGTGYGNQDTFTTNPALPAVTTASMSSIAGTTATAGGNVTYNGGATVTQRGVCWDTASNPTIGNYKTIDGSGNGTFTSSLTGLSYGTKYYLRAYATNIAGTVYGKEDTFTTNTFYTAGGGVTDIDGNVYTSVKIGSQEWTVQNLRTTKYANGDPIPNVTDTSWGNLSTGAWKWYDNNSQYEIPYGKLYNAYAVCDPRNACPTGWHVPADAEWNSLIKLLDNVADTNIVVGVQSQDVANKLKEIGNSHWIDLGGTNESGFTAVPGGSTRYQNLGNLAYWWSSTERNNKSGYSHWINDIVAPSQGERRDTSYKYDGLSVRCVKGAVVLPSLPIVSTTSITNITGTSASSGGTITSGGGGPVTARGVCYSTSPNPTLSNKKTIDGTGTGSYSSSIGSLLVNTTYYARAYATNVAGTAYGSEVSFTTTSQLYTNGGGVTDLDGNAYTSVIVGTQEWMVQNLKTTKYANGDPIPNVTDSAQWKGLSSGAWCYLNNDTSYNSPYGKLYNWYTVSDARNVCPTGWRVPSKSDWNKFVILLDPTADTTINVQTSNGGDKMKEAGTSHWLNALGTNESGFTALSFGNRSNTGAFQVSSSLSVTQWWSSKPNTTTKAFSWGVWNPTPRILESPTDKVTGFSIRCIK